MQEQNFSNHSRLHPVFHYLGYGLILLVIIGSIRNLYLHFQSGNSLYTPILLCLIGLILLLLAFYSRAFALRAQDRAIRAEENLRYFAITGKLLDSRLRMSQIIGLRFASNNEFVDLAHRAVEENLSQRQIKQAIQHWKADHDRV